jgi:hypothetical protein
MKNAAYALILAMAATATMVTGAQCVGNREDAA